MNNYGYKQASDFGSNTGDTISGCSDMNRLNNACHCPVCGSTYDAYDILKTFVDVVGAVREESVLGDAECPFDEDDLIDVIECYASAVAYGEQLLVWVPLEKFNQFLHPMFDEVLEYNDLHVVLDANTAMIDLTEVCGVFGLDMGLVYEDCEI